MIEVPPQWPMLDSDCRIAVVGEAPGRDEEAERRPFVGASGKLLDQFLNHAGILRHNCYIGNVCRFRPPANKLSKWFLGGLSNPNYHLINQGVVQLKEDLAKLRPNLIVALGNFALWALTGKGRPGKDSGWSGIATYRGSILETTTEFEGCGRIKVLPTFHPAAILRKWDWRSISMCDWLRISSDMKFRSLDLPQRTIHIAPNFAEASGWLQSLHSASLLSVDIERNRRGDITCIGFSDDPSRAYVIPFTGKHGRWWTEAEEAQIWHQISSLASSGVPTIGQNFNFDRFCLAYQHNVYFTNFVFDTMVAAKTAHPEHPSSLAFTTSIYTREPFYKDEGKEWSDPKNFEQFWNYNGKDAAVTLEIAPKLIAELERTQNTKTYERMHHIQDVLLEMSLRGVKLDLSLQRTKCLGLQQRLSILQGTLDAVLGGAVNVSSPKQMKVLLYDVLGCPKQFSQAHKQRDREDDDPTDSPTDPLDGTTSDKDALIALEASTGDPVLTLLLGIRHYEKQLAFASITTDPDQRVRCFFQANTKTGRLSSKKSPTGSGCNLQTIPEEVRDLFIADPGYKLVYFDLPRAEAVDVAFRTGDPSLIAKLTDPKFDFHKFIAGTALNKPPDQVTPEERTANKPVGHGTNYLMGKNKISKELAEQGYHVTPKECGIRQQRIFAALPAILRWHMEVGRIISSPPYVIVNAFGRRRVFMGRFSDQDTLREAVAHGPQSDVADIITEGIPFVADLWPRVLLLLQVHDALLTLIKTNDLDEMVPEVRRRMTIPVTIKGRTMTLVPDVHIGDNWGECH